jgi:predicted transcriptional regulator
LKPCGRFSCEPGIFKEKTMSATDLKALLHEQIDRLDDPDDLQDLALTMSEFVNHRIPPAGESQALIAQLRQALAHAESGLVTPHAEVVLQSKQWITK